MTSNSIQHVLIVGAGTMGQQIGLQCALHGCHVTLYDVAQEALTRATTQIRTYLDDFVAAGRLSAGDARKIVTRISVTVDPAAAAAQADLISESVPEDPALKREVFRLFDAHCPPHTIFTTNTSTLVPSMMADATGRSDRFAGLHFHLPVWIANVVDVMPHPGTSPEIVIRLEAFARQIGQIPITLQKENHGYVFNAMYMALNREALTLASGGVATVEDIDRAWMGIMKMPIGPMGMLDGVGLDTAWRITEYWAAETGDPQQRANADFLKSYVDHGRLGVKSGRGFYTYPNPAYARPGFLTGPRSSAASEQS